MTLNKLKTLNLVLCRNSVLWATTVLLVTKSKEDAKFNASFKSLLMKCGKQSTSF